MALAAGWEIVEHAAFREVDTRVHNGVKLMSHRGCWLTAAATALAIGSLLVPGGANAVSSDPPPKPKPTVDCSKPENKNKAACKNKLKELNDDALFHAGYWLARKGDYTQALHYLEQSQDLSPRVLTYIGFANRKLGHWDTAMDYYGRALAANPNFTVARGYLAEAYLERGETAKAVEQLVEIGQRCGTACDEYKELASAIAKVQPRG